jgi:hypothetical protein
MLRFCVLQSGIPGVFVVPLRRGEERRRLGRRMFVLGLLRSGIFLGQVLQKGSVLFSMPCFIVLVVRNVVVRLVMGRVVGRKKVEKGKWKRESHKC